MEPYQQYIRVVNGIVVYGFSTAFEQPSDIDMLLPGAIGRHFETDLMNDAGQFLYRFDGQQLIPRSQIELDAELASIPKVDDPIITLQQQVQQLTTTLGDYILGGGL